MAGRLVWGEEAERGGPYDVVVDGRTLSWDALGQALEPYEGWRFRLVLEDRCDDLRPDAEVIAFAPTEPEEIPSVSAVAASTTIDEVLTEFLADAEQRLSTRTFRRYAEVIDLLRHCLNGWPHGPHGGVAARSPRCRLRAATRGRRVSDSCSRRP